MVGKERMEQMEHKEALDIQEGSNEVGKARKVGTHVRTLLHMDKYLS